MNSREDKVAENLQGAETIRLYPFRDAGGILLMRDEIGDDVIAEKGARIFAAFYYYIVANEGGRNAEYERDAIGALVELRSAGYLKSQEEAFSSSIRLKFGCLVNRTLRKSFFLREEFTEIHHYFIIISWQGTFQPSSRQKNQGRRPS